MVVAGDAAPDLAQIDQFWSSELAEAGASRGVGLAVEEALFTGADPAAALAAAAEKVDKILNADRSR